MGVVSGGFVGEQVAPSAYIKTSESSFKYFFTKKGLKVFAEDTGFSLSSKVNLVSGTDCFNYPVLQSILEGKQISLSTETLIGVSKFLCLNEEGLIGIEGVESKFEHLSFPESVLSYVQALTIHKEHGESWHLSPRSKKKLDGVPFLYFSENLCKLDLSDLSLSDLPRDIECLKNLKE